jgi:hypothetical protein
MKAINFANDEAGRVTVQNIWARTAEPAKCGIYFYRSRHLGRSSMLLPWPSVLRLKGEGHEAELEAASGTGRAPAMTRQAEATRT